MLLEVTWKESLGAPDQKIHFGITDLFLGGALARSCRHSLAFTNGIVGTTTATYPHKPLTGAQTLVFYSKAARLKFSRSLVHRARPAQRLVVP